MSVLYYEWAGTPQQTHRVQQNAGIPQRWARQLFFENGFSTFVENRADMSVNVEVVVEIRWQESMNTGFQLAGDCSECAGCLSRICQMGG
jgi:hypothetical protein